MPTVLVVDDVPDACDLLARVLVHHGYEAVCALNGVEALAAIDAKTPDLILLDVTMPDMDGFEVLQELRSRMASQMPPVIMLSAIGDASSIERAKALGAKDYFVKASFDLGDMLAQVARHVA